jgi:hypothetical protein
MTTFDPDTAEQDTAVLEKIWRDLDGRIALDCEILSPGIIHVGDPVELIPTNRAAEDGISSAAGPGRPIGLRLSG